MNTCHIRWLYCIFFNCI